MVFWPGTPMCTAASGPKAVGEGSLWCRGRLSVALLDSATTLAATSTKIAMSGDPPPCSGPGRIPSTGCGVSGVNIGKVGTDVSACRSAETDRTLSWGWRAGGGGRIADTGAGIMGVPGGVRISSGTEAGARRRLFSGRRGALSDNPVRAPSDGDSLSRELQSHRA